MTTPNVKGIPLVLGGVTYTLPPASIATLEAFADRLDAFNASSQPGSATPFGLRDILFVADFAHACLRRNYPDLTRDTVAEHVGLDSVLDVLNMCLDTSGLLRKHLEAAAEAEEKGGTLGE